MKSLVHCFKWMASGVLRRHLCVTPMCDSYATRWHKQNLPSLLKLSVTSAKPSTFHCVLGTRDLTQRCHHHHTQKVMLLSYNPWGQCCWEWKLAGLCEVKGTQVKQLPSAPSWPSPLLLWAQQRGGRPYCLYVLFPVFLCRTHVLSNEQLVSDGRDCFEKSAFRSQEKEMHLFAQGRCYTLSFTYFYF